MERREQLRQRQLEFDNRILALPEELVTHIYNYVNVELAAHHHDTNHQNLFSKYNTNQLLTVTDFYCPTFESSPQ